MRHTVVTNRRVPKRQHVLGVDAQPEGLQLGAVLEETEEAIKSDGGGYGGGVHAKTELLEFR